MDNQLLLIRADANKKIGLGHVMRCLTIAEAAKKAGVKSLFLLADDNAGEWLQERGQAYCVLHTEGVDMEAELPALEAAVKGSGFSEAVFLLDSYRITKEYVQKLKTFLNEKNIRLALMEDYGSSPYQADILVNYNIYGTDFSYKENAAKTLLGCRYMPLRQAFVQQEYEVREQVKNILITTGGSDACQIGIKFAKLLADRAFAGNAQLILHIVCGRFSQSREALLAFAKQKSNITVYTDVKEMWTLMAKCDAAISAAGTTLYELCAVGVPTICFSFADNQILPGKAFAKHTPIPYAGDYEQNPDAVCAAILDGLEKLCSMPQQKRKQMSIELKELVDGKGAERIVQEFFG